MPERILLELTQDEALVLLDWLARVDDSVGVPVEDHSERLVLWRLEAQLDKRLVEPFLPDYRARVDEARQRVREGEGA